jgi:hypothetical protein
MNQIQPFLSISSRVRLDTREFVPLHSDLLDLIVGMGEDTSPVSVLLFEVKMALFSYQSYCFCF